ncbi:MAG: beta-carotene hydroxylase, partial [Cyanobium sp.]
MTQALTPPPADTASPRSQPLRPSPVQSVPKRFLDAPAAWNPTVALFLGGYLLAGLSIYGWFWAGSGGWPLPLLLLGFLALHLEGTVIH